MTRMRAQLQMITMLLVLATVSYAGADRKSLVNDALESDRTHATWWFWGWTTVYAGGMGYGGYQIRDGYENDNRKSLASGWVGGVKSAVGLAFHILNPITVLDASDGDDREKLLESTAEYESVCRTFRKRVVDYSFHAAGAAVILLGFDRPVSEAALSMAMGILSTELKILTTPSRSMTLWNQMKKGFVPAPNGIFLTFRF